MKADQKMTTLFFFNRKKASCDGLAPIYARVTIDSQKEEFSLSIKSPLEDWDNKRKRIIGKCQTAYNANLHIEQTRSKLERLFIVSFCLGWHWALDVSLLTIKTIATEHTEKIPDFVKGNKESVGIVVCKRI